ncbi:MAG: dTDP-4-dehydrorhamnose 3,5-epimerase [Acidobacteriota bacterium]
MEFHPTDLPGVILVEPSVFRDHRGFFLETYHSEKYRQGGIEATFVQDNHSRSEGSILRGLHAQRHQPQGKLVRCVEGAIWDVAVDIRVDSPTFRRWVAYELTAENFRQLYVPPGFAHGFCVLSDIAQVEYKCTDFYNREDEIGLRWNDPDLGIDWPIEDPVLSPKDAEAPTTAEVLDQLPRLEG